MFAAAAGHVHILQYLAAATSDKFIPKRGAYIGSVR